jgi:carbamoyltransferase
MELYHAGMLHPKDYAIPNAETNSQFEKRVRSALSKILQIGVPKACVVAHRSTITMVLNIISNWPKHTDEGHYEVIGIEPLSISIVEIHGEDVIGNIEAVSQPLNDPLFREELAKLERAPRCTSPVHTQKKLKYTLGINFGTHDTSACLLRDWQLVAAVEEERLVRQKSTSKFPLNSIRACVKAEGILLDELHAIALPIESLLYAKIFAEIVRLPHCPSPYEQMRYIVDVIEAVDVQRLLHELSLPSDFASKMRFYRHHFAHASSAYYLSGLTRSAVLVIDGVGELDTISIFRAENGNLQYICGTQFPNSLGKLYGSVCRYLGFSGHSKEGKVMGLEAYGTPIFLDLFNSFVKWDSGLPVIDTTFFNFGLTPLQPSTVGEKFTQLLGKPRDKGEAITQHHMDIAATLQTFIEDSVIRVARYTRDITGEDALCYAGGVALNCVANRRLREENLYRRIFIPPAPHDAGLSIGAAYLALADEYEWNPKEAQLDNAYLGPIYDSETILEAASSFNLVPHRISSPARVAANLLSAGHMVGWVQGKLEFGSRALGNRSLLADPRKQENKDSLNSLIKEREYFRPFAPSVLWEKTNAVFECSTGSPYMLDTFEVRPEWKDRIPAVVHVDGTARLQTVTARSNFLYYQLLRNFYDLTGMPVVLNTSLNTRDEPIVASPSHALELFTRTQLSYLVIGTYLFSKYD